MILTSLRLNNFRQFRGSHELRFSTAAAKNVTVITGPNGAGKTGIFLALNWCLYGAGVGTVGRLLSKGIPSDEGGFVEVHFRHEGVQYVARREIPTPSRRRAAPDPLQLLEQAQGRARDVANPVQRLNEILPADARTYFFFDGERIDEMTKPGHEEQVKEAIRSVLKLKVLERAITHVNAAEREFAQGLRANVESDRQASDLAGEMESVRDALSNVRKTREEKHQAIEGKDRELDEVMERLRSLDGVRDILIQESRVEIELAALRARAEAQHIAIGENLARSAPTFAKTAVLEAASILDEKRKRGEIPSSIRQTLIDDLLEAGMCICNRHLDEAARRALEARRKGASSDAMEDVVLQLAGSLNGLRHVAESIPLRMKEALEQWSSDVEGTEELQRRIDALRIQVDEELRGRTADVIAEDVKGLEGARHRLETERGDLRFDLGRIEAEVKHFEDEFSRLSEQLGRVESRSSAASLEKRRYELAYLARQAAEDLLVRFSNEMRQRIQAETDRIFKSIIWTKKQFDHVKVLDDYRLDVVDRYGASAHHELSAGQREILSLSFIVAMSEVTGSEAPLVIDTPFGRLSTEPLGNVVESLPGLVEQLVLLVTDEELNESAQKSLIKKTGAQYWLDFDDSTGMTSIVSGQARARG